MRTSKELKESLMRDFEAVLDLPVCYCHAGWLDDPLISDEGKDNAVDLMDSVAEQLEAFRAARIRESMEVAGI